MMSLATKQQWALPPEIDKALRDTSKLYSIDQPRQFMPIRETAFVWFAKKAAYDTWKRYSGAYGSPPWAPLRDSKPKWGQPGRHRRQKARLQARRRNEAMQRAVSMLRKMHTGAVLIAPGTQNELVQAP